VESMEPGTTRLLVDVGQTGSRIHLANGERVRSEVAYSPGQALEQLIATILSGLDNRDAQTVVLSLTGLRGLVPDISPLVAVCTKMTGCSLLGVCDDGLAWSVGSLAGQNGISLAVGGGVVAVARSGRSFFHADGNGSDFGDSGGAFWIGRKGIRAAIRAIEGSDEPTVLQGDFTELFGPHDTFVRSHVTTEDVHRAAISFAGRVLDASEAGDAMAVGIMSRGADRLGRLVSSLAREAGLDEGPTTLSLGGGLMENSHYRQLVSDRLGPAIGDFTLIAPRGNALDGLLLLAEEPPDDIYNLMKWWKE